MFWKKKQKSNEELKMDAELEVDVLADKLKSASSLRQSLERKSALQKQHENELTQISALDGSSRPSALMRAKTKLSFVGAKLKTAGERLNQQQMMSAKIPKGKMAKGKRIAVSPMKTMEDRRKMAAERMNRLRF